MVKILAASDIHGDVKLVKRLAKKAKENNVHAVILCGDLTFFNREVKGLLKPFKDAGLYVMIIPGNHEPVSTTDFFAKCYDNIKHLHGYSAKIDDVGFFGCSAATLGFSEDDETIETLLDRSHNTISDLNKKVMVVHEPPFGTDLDNIGFHTGNLSVRRAIERFQPNLCLCGHMHETFGKEVFIGSTRVINVGPEGMILEL